MVLDNSMYSESACYESAIKEVLFSAHCILSWTVKAGLTEMMFLWCLTLYSISFSDPLDGTKQKHADG